VISFYLCRHQLDEEGDSRKSIMKRRKCKITLASVFAVIAILGASNNASAESSANPNNPNKFSLGLDNNKASFSDQSLNGRFVDEWMFTLSGANSFDFSANVESAELQNPPNPNIGSINNLTMSLLDSDANRLWSGVSFNGKLNPGNYRIELSGEGIDGSGGYNGTFCVLPVPELPTWVLMALGVGLLRRALWGRDGSDRSQLSFQSKAFASPC
jgi:hypothetical protein